MKWTGRGRFSSSPGDGDGEADDDFQDPVASSIPSSQRIVSSRARRGTSRPSPLTPSYSANISNKKPKISLACAGKENKEWPRKIRLQIGKAEVNPISVVSPVGSQNKSPNRFTEVREAKEICVVSLANSSQSFADKDDGEKEDLAEEFEAETQSIPFRSQIENARCRKTEENPISFISQVNSENKSTIRITEMREADGIDVVSTVNSSQSFCELKEEDPAEDFDAGTQAFHIRRQIQDDRCGNTEATSISAISPMDSQSKSTNRPMEVREANGMKYESGGGSFFYKVDVKEEDPCEDFEAGTQLKELINLCWEADEDGFSNLGIPVDETEGDGSSVECPICGADITDLREENRLQHTNLCLDREEEQKPKEGDPSSVKPPVDFSPVVEWLKTLGLSRYEETFLKEEIDWDTLQRLTEEDLIKLGINALGPRKKILLSLNDMGATVNPNVKAKPSNGNKLITEFFQVPRSFPCKSNANTQANTTRKVEITPKTRCKKVIKNNSRYRDAPPSWCCIPGTPFRVDAFCYAGGDCSHWFLTHFHLDHYQGLTKNFHRGKIYCSLVTARLLNSKIGISWNIMHVLPLNEKITISGIGVTCVDANHCPGAIIILFEPPNGKAVLHTGDFRYCDELGKSPFLRSRSIHTLILDTTYCNPQYDFPRQEYVIQFIIESIQAEAFNPQTLFLIGSYTIGKERVFLEIARVLKKKVYVGGSKMRILECLGLPKEDMDWLTENEMESHVHVVPMWMIASFKRMSYLWKHYSNRFNLMVAFSPTGWSFGKGKKKNRAHGRLSQQGTMIKYEVPYSEHSSFTELREFVRLISPEVIIPSVNNSSPQAAAAMVDLLRSDSSTEPPIPST